MNLQSVERIANAVLYEGYLLSPYRASTVNNHLGWNFGVLYPQEFSIASRGVDASAMQTQCLIVGSEDSLVDLKIRFLQVMSRDVYARSENGDTIADSDLRSMKFIPVESLEVEGKRIRTGEEAVEREVNANSWPVYDLCSRPAQIRFSCLDRPRSELVLDRYEQVSGAVIRRQRPCEGEIVISAECMNDEHFRITVRISNLSSKAKEETEPREEALKRSLISTHSILVVSGGEFVSLLDPPQVLRNVAAACQNIGTYPVLVGDPEERDVMLSSPITLCDYPQIGSEGIGDLFDSTDIDEILALRIMMLTDEERREMPDVDDRARQILEKTGSMPLEQLMKLQGGLRGRRTVTNNVE